MPNKWRVLVADDHEDTVKMLEYSLKSVGCEVIPAFNGEEAVSKYREHTERGVEIDICVFDYEMPRMKGDVASIEIQEIAKEYDLQKPHILIFTGSSDQNLMVRLSTAEIGIALIKPYGFQQLLAFITRLGMKGEKLEVKAVEREKPKSTNFISSVFARMSDRLTF